ncbi:hypothetical protein C8A01DRAFT_50044 [Parachaetomium inaequale]|uniref:BTB domain-containing protein n=1 Tax=Parachaetomium inaequale TaxID=2588326 RepID=A0AAN6P7V1_9PEZI|nr:hypothetical protein C8A01DRAFT_50044 [Parachaetomium inaequale]
MDGVPWRDVGSSKPFRFIVGPEKREFTIHSALVAGLSPALMTLVTGKFSEARDGQVVLESVDEQTFVFFMEYAYTGSYGEQQVGEWSDFSRRQIVARGRSSVYYPYEDHTQAHDSGSDASRKRQLWAKFTSAANPFYHKGFYGVKKAEGLGRVFMRHAKMYVFADYYGIFDLVDLSLDNLGMALIPFDPNSNGAGDIVALLQYCYETPAPKELKSFVLLYAVCKAETLWQNKAFQELVAGNREISLAFIGQVMGTGQ